MQIAIIPVPYNLDEPRVGMGRAPEALLEAGLVPRIEALGCAAHVTPAVEIPDGDEPREQRIGLLLAGLGAEVARARAGGAFPLVLGGDCLTAVGTVAGLLDPGDTGIAWIDAHGDFNTPATTVSGYLGGMPLACIVGRGLDELRAATGMALPTPEENVALLGVRDLDAAEEELLGGSQVAVVRGDALGGGPRALAATLGALGERTQLYLHVDIDVLDPAAAPGVDFPAPGGLTLEELQSLVQRIAGMGNLAALALTAVNPEKDPEGRTTRAAVDVIVAAVSAAASAEL
jgi:arginase